MNTRSYQIIEKYDVWFCQYLYKGVWTEYTGTKHIAHSTWSKGFYWLVCNAFDGNIEQARACIAEPIVQKLPPPPTTPHYDTGWLNPLGQLYDCEDFNHADRAEPLGGSYRLLCNGWVHVGSAGGVCSERHPTQDQINWLYALWQRTASYASIKQELHSYLTDNGVVLESEL